MTISSTTSRMDYSGNGVTTIFPYTFKVFDASHLVVVKTDAAGVETTLVLTTDYTVSDVGADAGGNVTCTTAPASGTTLAIERTVPFTQTTDVKNQTTFFPEVHEDVFDRLMMATQQIWRSITRSMRQPVGDVVAIGTLPTKAARSSKYLGFDSNGDPVALPSVGSLDVASEIAGATTDATPDDAGLLGHVFNGVLYKMTWANLWASPGAIGGTTPAAITGTTITGTTITATGVMSAAAATAAGHTVRLDQVGLQKTNDFRLTLTSGLPVTTANVASATTMYCCPYKGNNIALYDGSAWHVRASSEFSLALGTLTSGLPYDVFCYDNAGTPTLEFLAWTNSTTRATALAYQDGVLSKTGALTRRYLGTFYTTSTTQTEDSVTNRYLWNYYHRVKKPMYVYDATASWAYTTATFRQFNASTTNQLNFLVGVAEDSVLAVVHSRASNSVGGAISVSVAVGALDSTTTTTGPFCGGTASVAAHQIALQAAVTQYPTAGRHFIAALEYSTAGTGTTTWLGGSGSSGIAGEILV